MIDFEIAYDDENTAPQQTAEFSLEYDDNQPDFTKVKANEIFSIDGSNTNAPMKLQKVNKSWMQKFTESDVAKFGETQSKAVARGLYQLGGGIGSLINWYGDNMILQKGAFGLDDKTVDRINTFGRGWQKFGEVIKKGSDFVLKDEGLKLDEEIFSGDIIDNPSLTRVTAAVMSAAPSLMGMVGIAKATGSTALSYFLMGGTDSAEIYEKSKEKGDSLDKTNLLYTSSMAGTALIDKVFSPLEKIMGGSATTIWKKLTNRVIAGGAEAGAEGGQTVLQNAIMKYGVDDTQNLLEGFFESMIGGFGAGSMASGMFEKASTSLKDKGATQQEIEGIINGGAEYIQKNADEINNIAYQHFEEGMANFDKFITENKDEALVAQALATKKELEDIYNDSYNELLKVTNEEQAKSNAALIRNSAFFLSEAFGLSPKEFMAKRGVKIQKSDRANFGQRPAVAEENYGPLMQVTQRDINWAKAHPEWKSNARVIEMIGQAGADINDSLDNINKALKEYSIKEYKHAKEMEIAEFDRRTRELSEDLQERYAMMVENGVSPQDAYNAVADTGDYIPFQTVLAKKTDVSTNVDPKQIRKDAKKYLLDKVRKQDIAHPELGKIRVSRKGIDEFVNTSGNIDKLALVPHLKELIETSRVGEKEDLTHPREDNIVAFYPLYNDAVIDGKIYDVTTKIGVDREGNLFYTVLIDENNSSESGGVGNKSTVANEAINVSITPSEQNVNKIQYQESLDVAKVNAELDKVNPAYEGETININGVERTVYNSNGDRIAMSEPALRNFYNWFGDSKVVDDQGRPLVVYHGTNKEFDSFDKKLLGTTTLAYSARQGFFFTDSEEVANSYGDYAAIYQPINELRKKQEMAERWGDWDTVDELTIKIEELDRKISQTPANERGQKIYPVYLKAEDVLEYDAKDEYFSDIGDEINDVLLKAKKQGKDGVVLKNLKDQPLVFDEKSSNHFVVFEPNQIKSTSNRGTYSESDNIYYQSAFAGSRVDYDKPSLEAIGSGEGAQAHGWGLYYALSKDVAEGYRKSFIRSERELVFPDSVEELAIKTYLKNNKNKEATIKELVQIEKDEKSKFGTSEENILAYMNAAQAQDHIRYADDNTLEREVIDIENSENGQVHEVDIPENPYLLDEQLPFSEQSDIVKKGIIDTLDKMNLSMEEKERFKNNIENKRDTGKEIYEELVLAMAKSRGAGMLYSSKENMPFVSKALAENGVKGITYWGRQDGRCFVIFNPDDVKVIQKFYQDSTNGAKGAYVNGIIHLFENADASTIPHELAHYWKDMLKDAAQMSKKAQKMLEDVEKWSNQEFDRKYSVQQKDGKFVVNNKQGLTVYDHNFRTAEDAKSYAQEELFAQGFEMYLKEGKAPNNSLKQAFRNFLMWLKHIYKQAMQLDIRLSPDMRNVFADILGGADIDFFLNTDPDTFIENRVKLAKESESDLDDQIAEAQRMGVKVSDPDGRKLKDVWEKAMIPLSTRLGRISNELRNRLRRYEFNITNSLNKYYDEARPFLQKWKNFSEADTIAFDIALKNDYVKKQLEIVDKYGAREEWEKVRKLLLDIYDSAIKAGLDVNFRPDYFPRKVKDAKGLLAYLRGTEEWTKFQEALREADPDNIFTEEEQADFINKYLRGFVKVDMMPYKYSSEKQRKIERINNEMNKFYAPSMESLVSYIEGMNARIKASEFLGRDAENLEESIGGYLTYLLDNKKIDPTKVDEVREILQARFAQKGVGNKFVAGMRNLSYMYTMGGINSAITQIEDLSVSMYKAGIWNTLTTAFENKKIKRADLGLNKISAEFVENPSKTARGVDKLFKLTGLDKIDSFGKETLVNAMVKRFKQMSDARLREYLEPIMEQETNQTIQDIRNGEMSDNVLYLVFSELSDVQPISLSELPAFYNTSGNLRILYMLKSFMVKRIDIFRNECFDKLRSGSKEARIEGMQNLFRLAILMIFCGVSKDWLINMLYGRKIDLPEMVVNNALGLVGLGKFHIYQARDKGAGEVIKDFLMPPLFAPYDDLLGDIFRIGSGKRDLKDAETLKGIPLIGRFYYWHIGRGKEKQKKRSKLK